MSAHQNISSSAISLTHSSISRWRRRGLRFALHAALVGLTSAAPLAQALVITDAGASGTAGVNGIRGTNGGSGGAGSVVVASSDLNNTASATGGQGGVGGNSLPLFLGGNGGRGGVATATLDVAGQQLDVLPPDSLATVNAAGGRGGNGGMGLLRGVGGDGGNAQASGSNNNPFYFEDGGFSALVQANAAGGAGGNGRIGGAGGRAQATATEMSSSYLRSGESTATAAAQGGNGGDATLLRAGGGGDADATAVLDIDLAGQSTVGNASAIGGNGGSSALGLHGDGGDATALADSRQMTGGWVSLNASAVGGASGNGGGPGPFFGTGGAATAIALTATDDSTRGWPSIAEGRAVAQGGTGAVRGGDAIAISEIASSFGGGHAIATATAGAGPSTGAAMAVAYGKGSRNGGMGDAVANAPSGFARQVGVQTFTATQYWGYYTRDSLAVAAIGDVGTLPVTVPTPAEVAAQYGYAVSAQAPTAQQGAVALAGHGAIAAQAATGSVWGLTDIATTEGSRQAEYIVQYVSYSFATDAIEDSGRLWLGLLNPDLPATFADFSLRILGEGALLFEQAFDVDLFDYAFNDALIDLGAWADVRGSDGLFNLDITFAGFVPELAFAFGSDQPIAGVPEPSALSLLLAGLLGLIAWSRHTSTM